MLEAENDIGEDLLKFGVCVREATQLMQAQLQEAFSKDDDDGPAPIERGQRGRSLVSLFALHLRLDCTVGHTLDLPVSTAD